MVLFEQHPYFVRRRSRASGYRRPCSSRVWSASRGGTLPSFFRAGRRLHRSWPVRQRWCSISTVDSFSFLILAFAKMRRGLNTDVPAVVNLRRVMECRYVYSSAGSPQQKQQQQHILGHVHFFLILFVVTRTRL